jgi:hypothetical protein
MAQRKSSRKSTARSRKRSTAPATRDLSRFVPLAHEGLDALARRKSSLDAHFQPIDELRARHAPQFDADDRFVEYAKAHGERYLDLSRRIGATVMGGSFDVSGAYLGTGRDAYADWFTAPHTYVYVADRPGSAYDPALRYRLEWTDKRPELNEWDPVAHATRWRDQVAIASKADGTCTVRSSTNGDETDVQAAVGALFQPTGPRSMFQFRALALWTYWIHLEADYPPGTPPSAVATSFSYGAVRLVAQSWRVSDGGDFRTDAIRDMEQWRYFVSTPNRFHAMDESGVANPGNAGWVDLPADRDRVYALWVILRCFSRSTYAPPSLSSAIVSAKCTVPFIFVEH